MGKDNIHTHIYLSMQAHWLFWAYYLEFKGYNTFIQVYHFNTFFLGYQTYIIKNQLKPEQELFQLAMLINYIYFIIYIYNFYRYFIPQFYSLYRRWVYAGFLCTCLLRKGTKKMC